MKKNILVLVAAMLSVFLVSGCGKKTDSTNPSNAEKQDKTGSTKPATVASFSPYFYKADTKGMSSVLTNKDYASWIQLSPTENVRVYVELFLEEKGKFTLFYYELQAAVADATVLNEQIIKGEWKLSGDKIVLSDIGTFSQKSINGVTQLTIGFVKNIQTAGLKDKQTLLIVEKRAYAALE